MPTAPTWIASGINDDTSWSAGSASQTVNIAAGHQSGDLLIFVIETANQAVPSTPSGWTEVPTVSPQGTGTAGAAGGVRLTAFYKWATSSSESSVSTGDSGDHQSASTHVFRGVNSSNPFNASAGSVLSSGNTSITLPSVTTTIDNCLVCCFVASDRDSTATTTFSSWQAGNLASITERHDIGYNSGTGGCLGLATGVLATAGSSGSTSVTQATSVTAAMITLALEPADAAVSGTLAVKTKNDTLSATGTQTHVGTLSVIAKNDTLSATGATTVVGSLTIVNNNDNSTASGSPVNNGSLSIIISDDLSTASGSPIVSGSLNYIDSDDYAYASGYQDHKAQLSYTLLDDTAISAGTTTIVATLDNILANDFLFATGSQEHLASLSIILSNDVATASGEVIENIIDGTLSLIANDDTLLASGHQAHLGTISYNLNNDKLTASGSPVNVGNVTYTLHNDTVIANGEVNGTILSISSTINNSDSCIAYGLQPFIENSFSGIIKQLIPAMTVYNLYFNYYTANNCKARIGSFTLSNNSNENVKVDINLVSNGGTISNSNLIESQTIPPNESKNILSIMSHVLEDGDSIRIKSDLSDSVSVLCSGIEIKTRP